MLREDEYRPLYVSEAECARRAGIPDSQWRRLSATYEKLGMVRRDVICKLRYWPAVRAFFDRHNGLTNDGNTITIEMADGKENPDGFKTKGRGRPRT